jgi:hypothetical protein
VRFGFLFFPVNQPLRESFKRYGKESPRAQVSTQVAEADDDDEIINSAPFV